MREPKELLEHHDHIGVRVIVVVPKDDMITWLPLGLALIALLAAPDGFFLVLDNLFDSDRCFGHERIQPSYADLGLTLHRSDHYIQRGHSQNSHAIRADETSRRLSRR